MRNRNETIRKIVSFLNNPEEQGGLWLPHIQRDFVWESRQIETLFDSIMREYPISTLLIWKSKERIRTRKFIDNYKSSLKLTDFYRPIDEKQKLLALDGQQRLQSFFIALKGSYEGRELYFDVLSGFEVDKDNIKYKFKFIDDSSRDSKWVRFKDLIYSDKTYDDLAEDIISRFESLADTQKKLIRNNVAKIVQLFKSDEIISYQELDSVEFPNLYGKDDVVEIFIRANSGGTRLEKSDLLFSLLEANWDEAEEKVEELQEELNAVGYDFTRDFILKTCLCLIDSGARYEVEKFRKKENLKDIEEKWDEISSAIKDVKDFVYGKTFIRSDRALPSYLSLIPVIYFRYNFKDKWRGGVPGLNNWIVRTLLTGAFGGSPDGLLDRCNKDILEKGSLDLASLNTIIKEAGRNLDITKKTILDSSYEGANLYLLFNLWYTGFGFNFIPSYQNNLPQIDHIFPKSRLKTIKVIDPKTNRRRMKYSEHERNQIANCMLLTFEENGAGGKGDTTPEEWFEDKPNEYLEMHLIPHNKELWKLENYESFIEARKDLLLEKFMEKFNK